ncbi:hypothetical protein CBR_g9107 [Chara braunii]|uniref:RING-type domain-containing protein n=1 Tax=Chara braunii TaxID=69332 RepID=A0A388KNS2_CHABU|nr:hypothetical protein CBR_g9107 [Chara braunii]|eukprot:GBG71694.1 hypothetical protein CBR_g9107 [Chara braunii]
MGNKRSRPVTTDGAGEGEPTLHNLLVKFVEDEGKGLSMEGLEEMAILLQSALSACIKAKERKAAWLCRVCLDSEVRVVLKPCRHACLCEECSNQLVACPICRIKVTGREKFILS